MRFKTGTKSRKITPGQFQGLDQLSGLRELYLSQNGIQRIQNLEALGQLRVLDLNYNRLQHVEGVAHLRQLTDFWAKQNQLQQLDEVERELGHLPHLSLVYLDFNPWSKDVNYR